MQKDGNVMSGVIANKDSLNLLRINDKDSVTCLDTVEHNRVDNLVSGPLRILGLKLGTEWT